ncbi:hypothetical protein OUZ56_033797 [Daphnia magna]|uniref:Uncharacterized protein n=1 Tax=Daphnia magna TaxID=35525 RepID=A0ABR0BB42_9CRUS|nr:hypothetical protein OUZ56_033797 [Daphnia magna]
MWACDSKISECDDFMLRTNLERLELLFAQQRCFEYFLPLSLDGHLKLADCPHPWHCAICDSSDHYQILCAPQRAYQEVIPDTCGQVGPLSLTVLPSRAGL